MKITGTVREFVEIGIIPNDTILNSFMDSIVEIVPSTEDLEKLVKGINLLLPTPLAERVTISFNFSKGSYSIGIPIVFIMKLDNSSTV